MANIEDIEARIRESEKSLSARDETREYDHLVNKAVVLLRNSNAKEITTKAVLTMMGIGGSDSKKAEIFSVPVSSNMTSPRFGRHIGDRVGYVHSLTPQEREILRHRLGKVRYSEELRHVSEAMKPCYRDSKGRLTRTKLERIDNKAKPKKSRRDIRKGEIMERLAIHYARINQALTRNPLVVAKRKIKEDIF